jgi:hemerythrin-like domain-containing protein
MARIVELLRREHRDISDLLKVLEDELAVFDRQERPDYEVIQAVIRYFQDYPDSCHHPKEDMIFHKLKARDPVAAKSVGNIDAEHLHETKRLARVEHVVRNILLDRDTPRKLFDDVMHDFIEQQRRHIEIEERVFFPAAAKALLPEDWREIDAAWTDTENSLFNVAMEEKCQSLRDRVLLWEQENRENRN